MNLIIISSGNDLSPVLYQAIKWASAYLMSIGPLGYNLNEIDQSTKFFFQENPLENVC